MKQKIALFDFDRTVISKDSILILYDVTAKRKPGFRPKLYGKLLAGSLFRSPKAVIKQVKNTFLSMLRFYTEDELKAFVYDDVMAYAFQEAVDEIFRLKEEGYYLLLVSASVTDYLKYVKDVLPFDHIIGTKTDARFHVVGDNNKKEKKVDNILAHLTEKNMEIDYEKSVAYSDSLAADRPMMELVKTRYLINNSTKAEGFLHLQWHEAAARWY
ncbi:MAG: HAD family hydrolase [Peptoniphilus sp.]|nr:HAD family hydrolase [Peptoniphilus sp.]MDY3118279.1 HAD family hydrolase [Peptoniphilus sp.]